MLAFCEAPNAVMLIKSVWRNLLFLVLSSVSISKLYFLLHTGISPFIQKLLGSSCSYTLFWHFDLLYLFINIYSVGQFWNLNWSGFQHFYNKFGKTFFFFFLNKRSDALQKANETSSFTSWALCFLSVLLGKQKESCFLSHT